MSKCIMFSHMKNAFTHVCSCTLTAGDNISVFRLHPYATSALHCVSVALVSQDYFASAAWIAGWSAEVGPKSFCILTGQLQAYVPLAVLDAFDETTFYLTALWSSKSFRRQMYAWKRAEVDSVVCFFAEASPETHKHISKSSNMFWAICLVRGQSGRPPG